MMLIVTVLVFLGSCNLKKQAIDEFNTKGSKQEHMQTGQDQLDIGLDLTSVATQIEGIESLESNYIDGVHLNHYKTDIEDSMIDFRLLQQLNINVAELNENGTPIIFSRFCPDGFFSYEAIKSNIDNGLVITNLVDSEGNNLLTYAVRASTLSDEELYSAITLCIDNGLDVTIKTWEEYNKRADYEILLKSKQLLVSELIKNGYHTDMPEILQNAVLGNNAQVRELINEGWLTDSEFNSWMNEGTLNELYFCLLAFGDAETLDMALKNIDFPEVEYDFKIDYIQKYPLLCPIKFNNTDTLEYLLNNGYSAAEAFENGKEKITPLAYAVYCNSYDCVKYLLVNEVTIDSKYSITDSWGWEVNILEYAAQHADRSILELIFSYEDNFDEYAIEKAMYWSIYYEKLDNIKCIYETFDDVVWTNFHFGYSNGTDTDVIKYINSNKIINFSDSNENYLSIFNTFFYDKNEVERLTLLIEFGNNVNAVDEKGIVPVFYAVERGRLDVLQLFVENGADVNQVCNGVPLIGYAVQFGSKTILEYLIEQGADINAATEEGHVTALMGAVQAGYIESVKILLAAGADKSIEDDDGRTALDYAKEYDYKTIIGLLED